MVNVVQMLRRAVAMRALRAVPATMRMGRWVQMQISLGFPRLAETVPNESAGCGSTPQRIDWLLDPTKAGRWKTDSTFK